MTSRRADLLAIAVLVLLGTLLFIDVLVGVNGFYMRDLTRYYYPTKQILREIVQHGEFPYWNRYFSAGQPIAANPEHEVFYPLTWLILLPSYNLGFRLHILIHVYIGLLGMYALLRSMELRPFAAWFGAMAWGLGGIYLSYINLLPILFCAAWLPLTCLFVRRFLLRRSVRDFALGALFLGLQFLVGEPTTVMQTGLLIGMYALYRGWYAVPRVSKSITRVLWIAFISAAGFAVGAAQMLPALDHVADSARSRPFDFDLVSAWSMPWAKFGEIVYPNILGHISIDRVMWYWGGGLYPGMGSPFLFSIYVGLLVIALAVGGAFVRPRGGRLVLLLCLVSALLALGGHTPLLKWMYRANIATSIRYPEKFAMLGIFTIIVFASQMLDRLMSGDDDVREGTLGFLTAATVIALALAVAGFTPLYGRVFMKIWAMGKSAMATKEVRLSHVDWMIAVARGAIAIALVWFAGKRNERVWIAAAAIYVAADLAYTLEELNPRMPRRFFDPPPSSARLPRNREDFRVFHEVDWYGNEDPARQYFSTGDAVYWVVRNGLFPMTPAGSRVRTVLERDYDKTALLPTIDLTDSVWDLKRSGRADWYEPFMAMSNAWFRALYRPFKDEQKRTGGDFKKSDPIVFVETQHYPRYYFADQLISIRGRDDFVEKLTNGRYTPAVAFVRRPAFTPANGVVRAVRETANTATLDVESFGQGFLVMSVTRHKYWDVRVDGQRVPTTSTNIAYQGIVVTPGRHRVTMVYRNTLVQIGLGVTGTCGALLLALAIFWRPRLTRPTAAYEEPVHVVADAGGTHVEPAGPAVRRRLVLSWRVPIAVGVAGASIVAALIVYNYVTQRALQSQLYMPKPAPITPEVALLQQYVRINTSNPPGNETAGARFLAEQLARGGVHAEIVESAPGRGNVYARIRGRRQGEGLMLLNHIDVVPATPRGWTRPPFAAQVLLDALYGRGTLDMKGIAICQLQAFLAIARQNTPPERDLVFLATADEEEGGRMGVEWLLAHRPDMFEGVRYVVTEGGINESFQDRLTYFGIEIGSKMQVTVDAHAPSRAVMQEARIALEPYFSPRDPDRVLPEIRAFLHDLAPRRIEQNALLENVDRTIAEGKFWLLQRPYKELTQNIVYTTPIVADDRGATMQITLYNLPDEDPDKRLAWLTGVLRPRGVTIEKVVRKTGPAPLSPRNTHLFALIADEVHRQWGAVPVGTQVLTTSISDARFLRARGIVCYGFWPFQVDFYETLGIHGANERVRIAWFQRGIVMMRRLVVRYVTQR